MTSDNMDRPTNTYPQQTSPLFSCSGVGASYEGDAVIEGIALHLNKGELVSLLGPSGVGKTTLFHLLAGVEAPDSGTILLDGEDITGQSGRVGYMLQKDLLLPYKTVLDNVSLPFVMKKMPKAEAREQVAPYFEEFGIAGYEHKYPHQLSGGMRQRAALLRTFLMGCPVTLLDEPFSALDALTKRKMHHWYLALLSKTQMTSLFITHDIEEAIFLSGRIYILNGKPGRITAEFTVQAPYPRADDFVASPDFMVLKQKIWNEIA